jgi:hypothetical protein
MRAADKIILAITFSLDDESYPSHVLYDDKFHDLELPAHRIAPFFPSCCEQGVVTALPHLVLDARCPADLNLVRGCG